MASQVDIANLALSFIGSESIASLTEASQSAKACNQFFATARDTMLSSHAWGFATRRIQGASVAVPAEVTQWLYAYNVPPTSLRLIGVYDLYQRNENTHNYMVESNAAQVQTLYTNVPTAIIRYVERVTDVTKFSQNAVNAMARLIASYISGQIRKDAKTAATQYQLYLAELSTAEAQDSNGQKSDRQMRAEYQPPWVVARRGFGDRYARGSDALPDPTWNY